MRTLMIDIDWTSIAAVLVWIVSGTGAGVLAFFLWENLEKIFPALGRLGDLVERYVTLALVVAVAMGGYGLQILLLYRPAPTTWIMFLEEAFSIAATSILSALALHGIKTAQKRQAKYRAHNLR